MQQEKNKKEQEIVEEQEIEQGEKTERNGSDDENILKHNLKDTVEEEERTIINNYTQIYVNNGIHTGDDASFGDITNIKGCDITSKSADSFWDKPESFKKWLKEKYETYPMALMISSAVFWDKPEEWVSEAAEKLYQTFEQRKEEDGRDAISSILQQFDAELCDAEMNTYTGKIYIKVVHLAKSEYAGKILCCVWREYPKMRYKIISWLKKYCLGKRASMIQRAVAAVNMLVHEDYYFFQSEMLCMIGRDKNIETDLMFVRIMLSLKSQEKYKKNIVNLMKCWNRDVVSLHHLLINLFVCSELKGGEEIEQITKEAVGGYIDELLYRVNEGGKNPYLYNLYAFFASGMRRFRFYRILIEKLYGLIKDERNKTVKGNVCGLFLNMFVCDLNLTRFEKSEEPILIKCCFVNHTVQNKICYVWQEVWKCRDYRILFYEILADWARKVKNYGGKYTVEDFVNRVLHGYCNVQMQKDICIKISRRI